jgi:hypothetical protein
MINLTKTTFNLIYNFGENREGKSRYASRKQFYNIINDSVSFENVYSPKTSR